MKKDLISAPSSKDTQSFYDNLMDGKASTTAFSKEKRFNFLKLIKKNSIKKFYVEYVKQYISKEDKVIDFGCGTGIFTAVTAPMCKEVLGIDIIKTFVSEGKRNLEKANIKNARIKYMSPNDSDLADNSFDVLILIDVIHHLEDIDLTLKETFRILKPNGRVIIYEPNKYNPLLYLLCLIDKNEWGLLKLGTASSYRKILSSHMNIEKIEYNGILIGPDSKLFLKTANFITKGRGRHLFKWLAPKYFITGTKL